MPHAFCFGLQVADVVLAEASQVLDSIFDVNAVFAEPFPLQRIVGHEADSADAELLQHGRGHFVGACIGR